MSTEGERELARTVYRDLNIARKYLGKAEPASAPRVVLIGGQPGAGKSSTTRWYMKAFEERPAILDLDELRQHHPRYREFQNEHGSDMGDRTHVFAGELMNRLTQDAIAARVNVIRETTMSSTEGLQRDVAAYTQAGYRANVVAVATRLEVSSLGVMQRYLSDSTSTDTLHERRFVPPTVWGRGYGDCLTAVNDARSFEGVDRVEVRDRDGAVLEHDGQRAEDTRQPDGTWTRGLEDDTIVTVSHAHLQAPWSTSAASDYLASARNTVDLARDFHPHDPHLHEGSHAIRDHMKRLAVYAEPDARALVPSPEDLVTSPHRAATEAIDARAEHLSPGITHQAAWDNARHALLHTTQPAEALEHARDETPQPDNARAITTTLYRQHPAIEPPTPPRLNRSPPSTSEPTHPAPHAPSAGIDPLRTTEPHQEPSLKDWSTQQLTERSLMLDRALRASNLDDTTREAYTDTKKRVATELAARIPTHNRPTNAREARPTPEPTRERRGQPQR